MVVKRAEKGEKAGNDRHDNRKGVCGLLLGKDLVLLTLWADRWCHSSLACFKSVLSLQLDLSEGLLRLWA